MNFITCIFCNTNLYYTMSNNVVNNYDYCHLLYKAIAILTDPTFKHLNKQLLLIYKYNPTLNHKYRREHYIQKRSYYNWFK